MKALVLRSFNDLKGNKVRKKGETFEVAKKRFEEINSTPHGILIKQIETEIKGDDNK